MFSQDIIFNITIFGSNYVDYGSNIVESCSFCKLNINFQLPITSLKANAAKRVTLNAFDCIFTHSSSSRQDTKNLSNKNPSSLCSPISPFNSVSLN